jgi:hypothetical protein
MPSVIGTDSGSGVNVAANYLKTLPSTQFGTRQISVINIVGVVITQSTYRFGVIFGIFLKLYNQCK